MPTPEETAAAEEAARAALAQADAAAGETTETTAEAQPEPAPQTVDKARLDREIAAKWAEKRRADSAEARLKALEALQEASSTQTGDTTTTTTAPAKTFTAADVDLLASQKAAEQRYADECNVAVSAMRSAHEDSNVALDTLTQVPRFTIEHMLAAEQELGLSGEVLYNLGKDRSELDRILSLSPARQSAAIMRYAGKLEKGAEESSVDTEVIQLSKASPAIKPKVGGNVQRSVRELSLDDPNLPIDEYMRRRNEATQKKRA